MKLIKGKNDLATVNPTLAEEWNYEKNGTLAPDMVTAGSNKKVWWKCDKGHEWEATIVNRSQKKKRLYHGLWTMKKRFGLRIGLILEQGKSGQ